MKAQPTPIKEEVLRRLSEPSLKSRPAIQWIATDCRFEIDWQLDAFGIDSIGRQVLLFLGPKEEESWLLTILDAIAWVEKNPKLLQERFQLNSLREGLHPRVILVSPEFSPKFLNRLESLHGIDVHLMESRWVEIAGEKRLRLRSVWEPGHFDSHARPIYPEWMLDPQGASFLRESIDKLAKVDPEMEIQWGPKQAQVLYRGTLLALLSPNDKSLHVYLAGEEKISSEVTDRGKFVRLMDSVFRLYIEASALQSSSHAVDREEILTQNPLLSRIAPGRSLLTAEEVEAISK